MWPNSPSPHYRYRLHACLTDCNPYHELSTNCNPSIDLVIGQLEPSGGRALARPQELQLNA